MSFKILVRGLDTDIGHRLSQILEDYPYCLLDAQAQALGDVKSADEWVTFFEKEELSVCLNLCSRSGAPTRTYKRSSVVTPHFVYGSSGTAAFREASAGRTGDRRQPAEQDRADSTFWGR